MAKMVHSTNTNKQQGSTQQGKPKAVGTPSKSDKEQDTSANQQANASLAATDPFLFYFANDKLRLEFLIGIELAHVPPAESEVKRKERISFELDPLSDLVANSFPELLNEESKDDNAETFDEVAKLCEISVPGELVPFLTWKGYFHATQMVMFLSEVKMGQDTP